MCRNQLLSMVNPQFSFGKVSVQFVHPGDKLQILFVRKCTLKTIINLSKIFLRNVFSPFSVISFIPVIAILNCSPL
jgi:hypothetical protein